MDSICTYPHYGRMRIWIQEAKNLPKRSQKLQLIYKQLFRNCVFKINTENAIKNFQRSNIFHVNIE